MQPELDPDVPWVTALSGHDARDAKRAVAEAQAERRLFAHLKREHRAEGRVGYGEIDAPLELHALVRLLQPQHVIEVGVSSGVSSAYLLHALEQNGRGTLHSIDLPMRPPKRARRPPSMSWSLPPGRSAGWAVPFPLRKRWDLRLGNKAEVIPLIAEELRRVDLVVYDVPHEETQAGREFRLLDPLLPIGGVVIADHGPGGGMCAPLRRWAIARKDRPVGRAGTGLYGMRARSSPMTH